MILLIALLLTTVTSYDQDVIIIGAGYAGLSAAQHLTTLSPSLKVQVYEASSRVGGRVRNWDTKTSKFDTITDDVVEVGGTFISPSHTALIALGKSVNIDIYNVSLGNISTTNNNNNNNNILEPAVDWPWWWWGVDVQGASNHTAGAIFHSFNGTFTFRTASQLINGLSNTTIQDLIQVGHEMDLATSTLKQCEQSGSTEWIDLDSITFEGWIRSKTIIEESRVILRNMCRGMIAQEPKFVSFLSIVKSMKGCWSGGDDDQYRFRGGSQAPLLKLQQSDTINIQLNTVVRFVKKNNKNKNGKNKNDEDDGYIVTIENMATDIVQKVTCKYVIVTGSPSALSKISFDSNILGHDDVQLLQRMPMGSSMKFFLIYNSPWWRESDAKEKLTAIYTTKLPADFFPIQTQDVISCQDHRPYSDERGAMMCWIEGNVNVNFYGLMTAAERKKKILDLIQFSFNNDARAAEPLTMQEFNWSDQNYIGGAYTGFFTPGTQSTVPFWKAYSGGTNGIGEKSNNVWFAGADWWTGIGNGYMEGAVRHGQKVAEVIIEREKKKSKKNHTR